GSADGVEIASVVTMARESSDELFDAVAHRDVAIDELRVDVAQHSFFRKKIEKERASTEKRLEVAIEAKGDECPKGLQELAPSTGPCQKRLGRGHRRASCDARVFAAGEAPKGAGGPLVGPSRARPCAPREFVLPPRARRRFRVRFRRAPRAR